MQQTRSKFVPPNIMHSCSFFKQYIVHCKSILCWYILGGGGGEERGGGGVGAGVNQMYFFVHSQIGLQLRGAL